MRRELEHYIDSLTDGAVDAEFRAQISRGQELMSLSDEDVARGLMVGVLAVQRWRMGLAIPHTLHRPAIMAWFGRQAENRLACSEVQEPTTKPWEERWSVAHQRVVNEAGENIADVIGTSFDRMALITAAPDLYRSLEDVLEAWVEDRKGIRSAVLVDAMAALKKARGEDYERPAAQDDDEF